MSVVLLTMVGPPANRFYGDAVIVCVDCEGWQGECQGDPSEIGITLLDTRKLGQLTMKDWRNEQLHSFHFRMRETMLNARRHLEHLRNLKFRQNVEESGAKRLGDAIRSHLRNLE